MISYTPGQIQEFYSAIPQALKDTIWDEKSTTLIQEIAHTYNLALAQESNLGVLVGRVLMGILPIRKFRETIQQELDIPEEQARAIAYEVRDKIFAPVAEELRKLHGLGAN